MDKDAIRWENDTLLLLDQRYLPSKVEYLHLHHAKEVAQAIVDMVVRGAPAIGITAAFGVVLSAREHLARHPAHWQQAVEEDMQRLEATRPTAVNLHWALAAMRQVLLRAHNTPLDALTQAAITLHAEDIAANRKMGQLGAALLPDNGAVLTHCNAGALATGGYGTALGVVRAAYAQGKIPNVYAGETRPWLQGARLTAWELQQENIPVTLIADASAAWLMQHKKIQWVIVGADRVSANGDVANKIGTYALAIAARHHQLGFMVVAPTSTIDWTLKTGAEIPIEERSPKELLATSHAPENIAAWNPVFDVTPGELIDAFVTERGVVQRPNRERMSALQQR